ELGHAAGRVDLVDAEAEREGVLKRQVVGNRLLARKQRCDRPATMFDRIAELDDFAEVWLGCHATPFVSFMSRVRRSRFLLQAQRSEAPLLMRSMTPFCRAFPPCPQERC